MNIEIYTFNKIVAKEYIINEKSWRVKSLTLI